MRLPVSLVFIFIRIKLPCMINSYNKEQSEDTHFFVPFFSNLDKLQLVNSKGGVNG